VQVAFYAALIKHDGAWNALCLAGFNFRKEGDNSIKAVIGFPVDSRLNPDWNID
jgi:hypothetical protein